LLAIGAFDRTVVVVLDAVLGSMADHLSKVAFCGEWWYGRRTHPTSGSAVFRLRGSRDMLAHEASRVSNSSLQHRREVVVARHWLDGSGGLRFPARERQGIVRSTVMRTPARVPSSTGWTRKPLAIVFFVLALMSPTSAPGSFLSLAATVLASQEGDACRKEICEGAVAGCLRTDQSLNPFARTEVEKKTYCGQYYAGCMQRSILADVSWYSPDTLARFLKCPS
jgi:hypothetical protein